MPQLHNRGSHSFRLSQDVNMQQQRSPDEGWGPGGTQPARTLHTRTHTHAHMDSSMHTYGFHVFARPGFFFFFFSLLISWGHTPPTRTLHRSAHVTYALHTYAHTHTLSPHNPQPRRSKVFPPRRTALHIPVILPPSWLVALVSNHTPPSPSPSHRVAPQQEWEGSGDRRAPRQLAKFIFKFLVSR